MRGPSETYGRYEADPSPFIALLAIAAGLFVSAPALLLGIGLARLARRVRVMFILLAAVGTCFLTSCSTPRRPRRSRGS